MKVKSLSEIDSHGLSEQLLNKLRSNIAAKGKEYILGVDEVEYKRYLVEEFTLEPLTVHFSSESISRPQITKETKTDSVFRTERYEATVYIFTISYSYSGSPILFKVRPSTWVMTSTEIEVNEQANTVSFSFKLYGMDPEEFKRAKNDSYAKAFTNMTNVNAYANGWNSGLEGSVNSYFQLAKNQYKKENDFFAAINVKVNKSTFSVFTPPTVRKKTIPQPRVDTKKEFASEPTMAKEMYDDILRVIYDSGKSMEKKPSLYKGKDEEGLRDQFLFVLETRYDGTTASGETFNRGGKTDIILKYAADASNLFVAECKFWHGPSEFLKAISQLFDRYLTWRDSKAALILFVTNKDFTNTINTMKSEAQKHPYYDKENGSRGETSFSYIFHLPQDKAKHVYFEIILFHYDK